MVALFRCCVATAVCPHNMLTAEPRSVIALASENRVEGLFGKYSF